MRRSGSGPDLLVAGEVLVDERAWPFSMPDLRHPADGIAGAAAPISYEYVGVRYDDTKKVGPIVTGVESMLRNHPEIDQSRTLMVNFDRYAPSSLDFFIYCFTRTTNWTEFHGVKQDVLLRILAIIEDHGAEVAFPTSTIHLAGTQADTQIEPSVRARDQRQAAR